MTNHDKTPDEPGTRRQADGPHVPARRPRDKDMREMQDPYDLPFPDFSDRWPPGRPEYAIVVDQLRGWRPGNHHPSPSSSKPDAPANQSPTWKPNHDPHPEVTAMTLTINDTTMTSDQTAHAARQAPGPQHGWEVSWLPGQILDRNTAITAMILADTAAEEDLHEGHRLWPHIQSWAAELGLTGPDAIDGPHSRSPAPATKPAGPPSRPTARRGQ